MVLFVTGNVSPERVADCVKRGVVANENPGEIKNHFEDEPDEVATHVIKKEFDIGTPQFVVAFKSTSIPNAGEDYVRAEAEEAVLTEALFGKSSPIYNRLYAENLINDTFSADYEGELTYAFTAISGESADPDKVYEAVKKYIDETKKQGMDEEAFERARRVCYGRAVSLFDRQEAFANEFVRFATKGALLMTYPKAVFEVTLSDVLRRLSGISSERAVLSAIYPKGGMKK